MATLYEIDEEILNCVDQETGEIIDPEKLAQFGVWVLKMSTYKKAGEP